MEISQTSLWGFYCRTPRGRKSLPAENTCAAWRWFSLEDSTSQSRKEVRPVKQFELYPLTTFPKKYIFIQLRYQNLREKFEPHDSVLAETVHQRDQLRFLNVDVSLKDCSSSLLIENKANSRTTFSTFFFIWSLSRHRKISKLSREIRTKVELDHKLHHRIKTNARAFHGWQSKVIFYGSC